MQAVLISTNKSERDGGRNMMQTPKTNTRAMPAILIPQMCLILASCGDGYEYKHDRLVKLVTENRIGDRDYWLEVRGDWNGEWYKVGLIFGFGGDADNTVCQEIADDQNSRAGSSTSKYRCVAAN